MRRTRMLVFTLVIASLFVVASMGSVVAQTTLSVWWWDFWNTALVKGIDDFHAANPDIQIVPETMGPSDVYENLLLAASAGEGAPDMVGLESSHLAEYVELGALVDITDQILPYYNKIDSAKWPAATDKQGRIYAMPVDSGPVALYYRRDVFEQAGLASDPDSVQPLVNTYDDYYQLGKLIKERTNKYLFPQAKANNDFRIFESLLWQRNAGYIDREGKVVLDNPKAIETLEWLDKLYKEDLLLDSVAWTAGWYAALDEGQIATIPNAIWLGGFLWGWICPEASGKWGIVPLPVWEAGDVRSANDGGSNISITSQCPEEEKEAAWKFIETIFTSKDYMLDAWKRADWFPSLMSAWEDPFTDEPVEFFGGQAYRRIFVEAGKQVPFGGIYSSNYSEMNSILQTYGTAYILGEIESAEESLTQAAEEIKVRTGRE